MIAAASVLIVVAATLSIRWRHAHLDLDRHIRSLVGPQAVDCGYVPARSDTTGADACALEQFRSLRPFWVRYGQPGIDSRIEWVFLRAQDGRLVWLWYDSDVRGSGSALFAQPRVFERPCSGQVLQELGRERFTCE